MTSSRTKEPAHIDRFDNEDGVRASNEIWERELQEMIVRVGDERQDDTALIERLVARTLAPSTQKGVPIAVEESALTTLPFARKSRAPRLMIWAAVAIPLMGAGAWAASGLLPRSTPQAIHPPPSSPLTVTNKARLRAPKIVHHDENERPSIEDESPPKQTVKHVRAPSASALFAQLKRARRAGEHAHFFSLGKKLQASFSSSSEAHVARVMLASEYLRRGAPQRALTLYAAYLKRGGTMSQEALAGKARSLGQLGRRDAERQAWQTLIERFPGSVHASQAKQRITQLSTN